MVGLLGIEVSTGALAVVHRAITKFMDVEAVLTGRKAAQLADDFDAFIGLFEGYLTSHFVISQAMHHRDGVRVFVAAHFRGGAPRIARRTPSATAFLRLSVLKLQRYKCNGQTSHDSDPG